MNKKNVCVMVFIALFLLSADVLLADDLSQEDMYKCPKGIVSYGNSEYEVLEKCGKPTLKTEMGMVWVYDRGPSYFVYYIKFDSGSVLRISSGSRGK